MDFKSCLPFLLIGMLLMAYVFVRKDGQVHFYEPREARRLFNTQNVRRLVDTYKPIECAARSDGRASSPHSMIRQYMLAV
jgi:hypothetical protein